MILIIGDAFEKPKILANDLVVFDSLLVEVFEKILFFCLNGLLSYKFIIYP